MPTIKLQLPPHCAVCAALLLVTVLGTGCNGGDTTPTNTKNSQYINSGQTAADKIGAGRLARPRLPHAGEQPKG
jgi:hypothetical protein